MWSSGRAHAILLLVSSICSALVLFGCTDADPILARFDGGEVRVSDIDREIRFLPPNEHRYREHMKMSEERKWADWTRRVALRARGLHLAEQDSLTADPRLREQARRAARDWVLQQWEQVCYGLPLSLPSDDVLKQEVRQHAVTIPNRLRLSHIFLRTRTPEEDAAAQRQLTTWRAEMVATEKPAETFHDYARRYSHSQTATKGGTLGWLHEGWLPKAAEHALYPLPSGTLSEPLKLRGGWHLFLVEDNSPAHTAPLDRKVATLRAQHAADAKKDCRRQTLAAASVSHALSGTTAWPDVTIGTWAITGQLLSELYPQSGETPEQVRTRYVEAETLYQTALASTWLDAPMRRRMEDLQRDVWFNAVLQKRVSARLQEPTPKELHAAYTRQEQPLETRRALQLHLLKTRIPEQTDPLLFFDTLTTLADGLRAGTLTWEQIAAQLNGRGTVEAWPLQDTWELAGKLNPPVFQRVVELARGGVTIPLQDAADFYVIQIVDEEPPRPMTIAEATPQLRAALMRERGTMVTEQVVTKILESARFRLTAYGQRRMGDGGQGSGDGEMGKESENRGIGESGNGE